MTTTPPPHTLTVTLRDGKHVRARVIYLQPKAERWRESSAHIHILCSEWIEPYWHTATYHAGGKSYSGKFMPHRYREHDRHDWRFEGTFERDANS